MVSPGEVDYGLILGILLNLCHYWGLGDFGLVYLGTQPYIFHKHLQYRVITKINMTTSVIGVNMVGIILTTWEDQWAIGIGIGILDSVLK